MVVLEKTFLSRKTITICLSTAGQWISNQFCFHCLTKFIKNITVVLSMHLLLILNLSTNRLMLISHQIREKYLLGKMLWKISSNNLGRKLDNMLLRIFPLCLIIRRKEGEVKMEQIYHNHLFLENL